MCDGVAQHVFKRRGDSFDNSAIHFTICTFKFEIHLLAKFFC